MPPLEEWEVALMEPVTTYRHNYEHSHNYEYPHVDFDPWALTSREREVFAEYVSVRGSEPEWRHSVWERDNMVEKDFNDWVRASDIQALAILYHAIEERERRRAQGADVPRTDGTVLEEPGQEIRETRRLLTLLGFQTEEPLTRLLWNVWLSGVRWRDAHPDEEIPKEG